MVRSDLALSPERKLKDMDVVCLGELLVDMFPAEIGRRLHEVSAFRPKPGGAPANVAVGLARLGASSAFVGKVGDDAFGHHLARVLAQEGVDTRAIRFDSYARTTMAFIANPDPDTAEFVFYRNPGADMLLRADELNLRLLSQAKAFHFGSLSLVDDPIKEAALAALKVVKEAGGLISLDVNFRPSLWNNPELAHDTVMEVLPRVNLLKVNETELELLSGVGDLDAGSMKLLDLGIEACVVTLGDKGSYFRTAGGAGFVPAFRVDTVDATGCGDGFVAGLLSRLVTRGQWRDQHTVETMSEILRYANAVGALTAQTQGVIPALPTAEMVERFIDLRHQARAESNA
jgi:fructokinase